MFDSGKIDAVGAKASGLALASKRKVLVGLIEQQAAVAEKGASPLLLEASPEGGMR